MANVRNWTSTGGRYSPTNDNERRPVLRCAGHSQIWGWSGGKTASRFERGTVVSFPGFREYSLVIRVGTSVFQGGTDERFTITNGGVLELCQNDLDSSDNSGSWQVNIELDELGPRL